MTCSCPFCPLVEANIQVCDVLVSFKKDGCSVSIPAALGATQEIADCFNTIAKWARYNQSLTKVGTSVEMEDLKMTLNVAVVRKNIYKVCFHAKATPAPREEDPASV
jgi:hypothetical protein